MFYAVYKTFVLVALSWYIYLICSAIWGRTHVQCMNKNELHYTQNTALKVTEFKKPQRIMSKNNLHLNILLQNKVQNYY